MPKYEVCYAELRYTDESKRIVTGGEWKFTPFEADDDSKAEEIADALLKAPSDNPLVHQKLFIKVVKIVKEWTRPV